jgi:hypothetical protein
MERMRRRLNRGMALSLIIVLCSVVGVFELIGYMRWRMLSQSHASHSPNHEEF